MTTKNRLTSTLVLAFGGAAVIVAGLAVTTTSGSEPEHSVGQTVMIKDSYAFDVSDLGVLMDHTGDVVVGDVASVDSTDLRSGTTRYTVAVTSNVRGMEKPAEIAVTQLGYIDEEGIRHVPEQQELLNEGQKYLLALNQDPTTDSFFVVAGAHAIRAIASARQQAELEERYVAAAER